MLLGLTTTLLTVSAMVEINNSSTWSQFGVVIFATMLIGYFGLIVTDDFLLPGILIPLIGSVIVGYLAQTPDGRTACENGHSQWISNQANLLHAHRMRALCDAVMVGWKTVAADNCKLTVRHVRGPQPKRIILDPNGQLLDRAKDLHLFAPNDEVGTLFVTRKQSEYEARGLQTVEFREGTRLSETLSTLDIKSVYLEGGAKTVSSYLPELDLLQVHVAPKILGSGISSFTLPKISSIQEGYEFTTEFFDLDGEILYECKMQDKQPVIGSRTEQANSELNH